MCTALSIRWLGSCNIYTYSSVQQIQPIYLLFPGDYLSVISGYYQVLVEVPLTSAVCLD